MKITIYAEDTHSIAPILAHKLTGAKPVFRQISLRDMLNLGLLKEHICAAEGCVVFVIDREGARSHERPNAIRRICGNFQLLCDELKDKGGDLRLLCEEWERKKRIKLERKGWPVRFALVIIEPNQEAWIINGLGTLRPGKMKVYDKPDAPTIARVYLRPENIGCESFIYFKKIITGEIQDGCNNDYHRNQCGK